MPFKDLLKKKDKVEEQEAAAEELPVFTFMRSDTNTQELIRPPTFSSHDAPELLPYADAHHESRTSRLFKGRSRSGSVVSNASASSRTSQKSTSKGSSSRRLSERLHLRKGDPTSESVPQDLPEIQPSVGEEDSGMGVESQWEKRATILAMKNEESRSRPVTPVGATTGLGSFNDMSINGRPTSAGRNYSVVSSKQTDDNIQEAIRLHEAGDLVTSTSMFGRLADPNGENNALSQVLYGLALRHGWGCDPNPAEAVKYLSAAASNAASVENLALQAGMKKGGAAKGELVLAIFELANCFRHGWGVQVDKFAAKQYYETAANLGDTGICSFPPEFTRETDNMEDAMNEVAWCYLEGFGCKKDKYAAARYYRLAEQNGSKTLGNSWIWKEKYDPDKTPKK